MIPVDWLVAPWSTSPWVDSHLRFGAERRGMHMAAPEVQEARQFHEQVPSSRSRQLSEWREDSRSPLSRILSATGAWDAPFCQLFVEEEDVPRHHQEDERKDPLPDHLVVILGTSPRR